MIEPLSLKVTVNDSVGEPQRMWINIPNTYWNRFFLFRSSDRIKKLEDLYTKFKHHDEAFMGYIKGKLYGLAISDMPDGSFKCENSEF